jgi:hypothetical protein
MLKKEQFVPYKSKLTALAFFIEPKYMKKRGLHEINNDPKVSRENEF